VSNNMDILPTQRFSNEVHKYTLTFSLFMLTFFSQVDLIDLFGRIPVKMRSMVTHIISLPGASSSGANYGGPIVFTGEIRLDEMVHEVGHSVDRSNLGTSPLDQSWFSGM
jgi:cysteine sulfinate desulfinase/cysteine desulfurase-like protein